MILHLPTLRHALRVTFSPQRFRTRHAVYALGFTAAMLLVWAIVTLARVLDRLLWPGYRAAPIREPIYILANPRSGTTFMHRLMCMDEGQFTYLKLTHTIFPAIAFYRLWELLGRIDQRVGRPFERWLAHLDRRAFGGWDDMHKTGLNRSEEDEQYWVFTALTPALMLLFPWLDEFPQARYVDSLPARQRARLAAYYRDNLQRHVYARGGGRRLLLKNALIAGRLETCLSVMPDARIIHLVRHPYEAIPSLISMFSAPWKAHSPQLYGATETSRALARLGCDYYRTMLELRGRLPANRYVEIRYEDLVADPEAAVVTAYTALGMPVSPQFRAALATEAEKARAYRSSHAYDMTEFGITPEWLQEQMPEVFAAYGFRR